MSEDADENERADAEVSDGDSLDSTDSSIPDGMYDVAEIVGYRRRRKQEQFLTRWENSEELTLSFEPHTSFPKENEVYRKAKRLIETDQLPYYRSLAEYGLR